MKDSNKFYPFYHRHDTECENPLNYNLSKIDVTGWEMIESITWYLKNTKETLPKFQENCIYIKKIIATNIYHIFWVYNWDCYTEECYMLKN